MTMRKFINLVEDVFHGSPHKFDKFSLDYTKTGEGHHAYGWGLYFAGSKEVAEFYRVALSAKNTLNIPNTRHISDMPGSQEMEAIKAVNRTFRISLEALDIKPGEYRPFRNFHDFYNFNSEADEWDKQFYEPHKEEIEAFINRMEAQVRAKNPDWTDQKVQEALTWFGVYRKRKPFTSAYRDAVETMGKYAGGHLYHVELPKKSQFLLWDEPFKKQSLFVKKALKSLIPTYGRHMESVIKDNDTGQIIYAHMSNFNRNVARADNEFMKTSLDLNSVGIVGIKYLNGDSREQGHGDYNYVIFDDKVVNIKDVK